MSTTPLLNALIRHNQGKIIEQIAKDIHESMRKPVEAQNTLSPPKTCTYRIESESTVIYCSGGNLQEIHKNGESNKIELNEKCPRCKGTGNEPFLSWDEIPESIRESRRESARFILDLYPMMTRRRMK